MYTLSLNLTLSLLYIPPIQSLFMRRGCPGAFDNYILGCFLLFGLRRLLSIAFRFPSLTAQLVTCSGSTPSSFTSLAFAGFMNGPMIIHCLPFFFTNPGPHFSRGAFSVYGPFEVIFFLAGAGSLSGLLTCCSVFVSPFVHLYSSPFSTTMWGFTRFLVIFFRRRNFCLPKFWLPRMPSASCRFWFFFQSVFPLPFTPNPMRLPPPVTHCEFFPGGA